MDIAEKKRAYDALKALSNWLGFISGLIIVAGIYWFESVFNILTGFGFLMGALSTSLLLFARYRFGLVESYKKWLAYQVIIVFLFLGFLTLYLFLYFL